MAKKKISKFSTTTLLYIAGAGILAYYLIKGSSRPMDTDGNGAFVPPPALPQSDNPVVQTGSDNPVDEVAGYLSR
jgi:hypothetical protein